MRRLRRNEEEEQRGLIVSQPKPELAENFRQSLRSEMRVEAAGIGQDPNEGISNALWLQADGSIGIIEREAVSADAEDGSSSRFVFFYFIREGPATLLKFFPGEFPGPESG